MIHLTEKSFILHLPKGHAQRCPQLVPTHRARLGWRCATLQWPRVAPQVSQVCPGSVVPKQLITFLVGLNVGWTQILSYDSWLISIHIQYPTVCMKQYESNRDIMKSISSLSSQKGKVAILESRVLMMVKGSDDISSTWEIYQLKSPGWEMLKGEILNLKGI